jgi:hypothetical protein
MTLASFSEQVCAQRPIRLKTPPYSTEVTAGSLYEAVAAALASLRQDDWVGEIGTGLTTVRVEVLHPPVTHEVKMKDFQAWLQRKSGSPADMVLRDKLLMMLAGSRGGRP